MPPRQRITRGMILDAALALTRTEGIGAVNARSVAKFLGCSTQPVFSQFATMEALRRSTFDHAGRVIMEKILQYQDRPDFLQRTDELVLNLARDEPRLFHLLYLSDSFESRNLWEVMMDWECNRKLVAALAERYGLGEEDCRDIFLRGYLLLYGVAAMIATNQMDFTNQQALDMVRRTVGDMVCGARKEEP